MGWQGRDWLKRMLPGGGSRGVIVLAVLVLAGLGAWTAYYTVPSDSVAIVQRFGKYLEEVPPGLHFKLPLGVDEATIVPVKRQLKQEFGFATPGARDPYQSPRDGKRETEMVTVRIVMLATGSVLHAVKLPIYAAIAMQSRGSLTPRVPFEPSAKASPCSASFAKTSAI